MEGMDTDAIEARYRCQARLSLRLSLARKSEHQDVLRIHALRIGRRWLRWTLLALKQKRASSEPQGRDACLQSHVAAALEHGGGLSRASGSQHRQGLIQGCMRRVKLLLIQWHACSGSICSGCARGAAFAWACDPHSYCARAGVVKGIPQGIGPQRERERHTDGPRPRQTGCSRHVIDRALIGEHGGMGSGETGACACRVSLHAGHAAGLSAGRSLMSLCSLIPFVEF